MQYLKAIVVLLLVGLSANAVAQNSNAALNNSVAVLPFENLSPNPDDAYLSAGIHEQLLFQLTKIRDINPISRPAAIRNAGDGKSIAEIAAMLNVETIMTGSVRYENDRVNMVVNLIDASTNNQLWSETYDRDFSDIFAIQTNIVEHIVMALGAELTASEQQRIEKAPTNSLEAYKRYMNARVSVRVTIAPNMPPKFYQYLNEAISLDPDFALAHALKSSVYGISHLYGAPRDQLTFDEIRNVAQEHADIAVKLDPNLGLGYMGKAFVHFSNLHGAAARQAFERALGLSPNDVEIYDGYRRFLSVIEDHDEAIRLAERDIVLTPNVGNPLMRLGQTSMFAGKPSPAVESLRIAVELFPQFHAVHRFYAMALITAGKNSEALEELRISEKLLNDRNPTRDIARTAYGYSVLGFKEDAMRIYALLEKRQAEGKFISIRDWIEAYLAIGEIEKAYGLWSKTPKPTEGIRSLQFIQSNIVKNPVLEEPRFVKLRKQLIEFKD